MKLELETLTDHTVNWDWANAHVSQSFIDTGAGNTTPNTISINDIIESGTVLIAAGPADLDKGIGTARNADGSISNDGIRIVPIGLIETAQISMNKPLSRIFEIGSQLSYIIPGRTIGGISISRVFFDGPSLLKAIYMGEVKADFADDKKKWAKFQSSPASEDAYQEFAHLGSGNIAMNLASSFFDQPVGLAFLFRDQQDNSVGQIYFEGCRVSTYNIGISAQMNVLTEAISMEFIRCRPIVTAASSAYIKTDPTSNLVDLNIVSAVGNTGT